MRPPGAGCTVAVTTMGLLVTLAGTAGPSQQSAQTTEAAPVVIIAQDAPSPLVVHARKALASGSLAKWERNWYEKIVAGTVTPKRVTVWQTQYGMWDRGRYKGDLWHLACNPCNLKPGTVVWLPSTGRLHVVTNRGASSNDRAARGHGGSYWVDVWTTRSGQYGWTTQTGSMYVIGRAPWRH